MAAKVTWRISNQIKSRDATVCTLTVYTVPLGTHYTNSTKHIVTCELLPSHGVRLVPACPHPLAIVSNAAGLLFVHKYTSSNVPSDVNPYQSS